MVVQKIIIQHTCTGSNSNKATKARARYQITVCRYVNRRSFIKRNNKKPDLLHYQLIHEAEQRQQSNQLHVLSHKFGIFHSVLK